MKNKIHFQNESAGKKKMFIFVILWVVIGVMFVLAQQIPTQVILGQTKIEGEATTVASKQFDIEITEKIQQVYTLALDYEAYIKNSQPVVLIDAGHGGIDDGCINGDFSEKDFNLAISLKLKNILISKDYKVVMSRETDIELTKEERVTLANSSKADVFVSIHQNTYDDESASGIETWIGDSTPEKNSLSFSESVHNETISTTQAKDRGVRTDIEFLVTRETEMPSCIIETGYLSNPQDLINLQDESYQLKIATGIANGIESYLKPKILYLTFDDGPSAKNTGSILDILKERNIKATFFVIAETPNQCPQLKKKVEKINKEAIHSEEIEKYKGVTNS